LPARNYASSIASSEWGSLVGTISYLPSEK
jgi:hypothetical protein